MLISLQIFEFYKCLQSGEYLIFFALHRNVFALCITADALKRVNFKRNDIIQYGCCFYTTQMPDCEQGSRFHIRTENALRTPICVDFFVNVGIETVMTAGNADVERYTIFLCC